MFLKIVVTAIALLFSLAINAAGPAVKQSSSGICHPPESSWYDRTKNYTPFDSVRACLDADGRLPSDMSLEGLRAQRNPTDGEYRSYDRAEFGHGWDDVDGDCQDSRAEALIATSTTEVRFADDRGCRVVTGRWISPFTGTVIQNAGTIDIDHVVPLAWAWERDAREWSKTKRERFANDPINLIPVEASLNRSKGARGPSEWLPPNGRCDYVARFTRVLKRYELTPSANEADWMREFLKDCQS